MVAAVIAFPKLVIDGIDQGVVIDADKALESMSMPNVPPPAPVMDLNAPGAPAGGPSSAAPSSGGLPAPAAPAAPAQEDPMKALLEAVKEDAQKKK
jgi:hypothetical protein